MEKRYEQYKACKEWILKKKKTLLQRDACDEVNFVGLRSPETRFPAHPACDNEELPQNQKKKIRAKAMRERADKRSEILESEASKVGEAEKQLITLNEDLKKELRQTAINLEGEKESKTDDSNLTKALRAKILTLEEDSLKMREKIGKIEELLSENNAKQEFENLLLIHLMTISMMKLIMGTSPMKI